MKRLLILLASLALLALALSGCANKPAGMHFGTVQMRLTDAPGDIEALHLVINQVSVHRAGSIGDADEVDDDDNDVEDPDNDVEEVGEDSGWEVVTSEPMTVDLMTLRNGVFTGLGTAVVPAGRYTQIRLKLGEGSDVVIDGVTHPLVVPSGLQSGLKLIHPFTVPPEGFVDLLLDIDAQQAVSESTDGKWMLHPTVKVTQSSGGQAAAPARTSTHTF